jgi:hypothetical protein
MAPKGQVAVRMNVDSSLMPSGLGTMLIENIRNHRISPPGWCFLLDLKQPWRTWLHFACSPQPSYHNFVLSVKLKVWSPTTPGRSVHDPHPRWKLRCAWIKGLIIWSRNTYGWILFRGEWQLTGQCPYEILNTTHRCHPVYEVHNTAAWGTMQYFHVSQLIWFGQSNQMRYASVVTSEVRWGQN